MDLNTKAPNKSELTEISPSILSADFANLASVMTMLNNSAATRIHCDVMDGVFVPNLTFGFGVIAAIRPFTAKPLDVHAMIIQPERYIQSFKEAGADTLVVHYEAVTHLDRCLHQIKSLGMRSGVALNPATPVTVVEDVLYITDVVTLMSVNPGFGAQSFIENTYVRLRKLRQIIDNQNYKTKIEVDGGVSLSNILKLKQAGANILVAGNAVFKAPDPLKAILELQEAVKG